MIIDSNDDNFVLIILRLLGHNKTRRHGKWQTDLNLFDLCRVNLLPSALAVQIAPVHSGQLKQIANKGTNEVSIWQIPR